MRRRDPLPRYCPACACLREQRTSITTPGAAVAAVEGLARRQTEAFYVLALDARNRIAGRHLVAAGSLASVMVHPREVFVPLVRRRAAAAILVHNHPSGDPHPSPEDEALTERLVQAGKILGIPVLDHIIVARDGYFAFREEGRLKAPGEAAA